MHSSILKVAKHFIFYGVFYNYTSYGWWWPPIWMYLGPSLDKITFSFIIHFFFIPNDGTCNTYVSWCTW